MSIYKDLDHYWSIEFIPSNGMHIVRNEIGKMLHADTFEACTDYILRAEGVPNSILAYDDIEEGGNWIYPTSYFYKEEK